MIETKIYVGLNDAGTKKQEYETSKYVSILRNVCKSYRVAFSLTFAEGGYMHEDGEYIEERTLVISLIDVDRTVINDIARDLCTFFHQESVLITDDRVRAYYINQKS